MANMTTALDPEGKTIYSLYNLHSRILAGACIQID